MTKTRRAKAIRISTGLAGQSPVISMCFTHLHAPPIDPIGNFDWTDPLLLAYAWLWQPFTLWSP